jgi:hypothetical protein
LHAGEPDKRQSLVEERERIAGLRGESAPVMKKELDEGTG